MRLTKQEVSGIVDAIEKHLTTTKIGELRLYGSRVDDTQKGGDIDLLLIMPTIEYKRKLFENKHKILSDLKENIGERKVDLLICAKQDIVDDPFVNLIYPSSILLIRW
ncbi:MAG: nucleotidyltransferase domain-containing protein [Proteobacteria bacterium]|nr:nucleotidyltransferase domain-containing protein [Pseudomonadota bacterium]